MAAALQFQESSCFTTFSRFTYHVFLSFRGEDTRKNFTDHLYTALINAGIITFRDDDEIPRGGNIEQELKKAIRESKVSVVVFSRNYATSRWCLDELVRIVKRKNLHGQVILPVFYDVEPFDVGNQSGSFAEAFLGHEEKIKGLEEGKVEWIEKIEVWRKALREVAGLEGEILISLNRHEAKFIQKIVKELVQKLDRTVLSVPIFTVDIEPRIRSINAWLQDGAREVGIGILCGMPGVGKTTIAKVLYNLNYDNFDASCFLADIREVSTLPDGLAGLQRQLLSKILQGRKEKVNNIHEGITKIRESVGSKKILLVLDDVDQVEELNYLFGMRQWYHPGSKVIVTSRNKKLLKSYGEHEVYTIQELDDANSLELFSWYAFGQDHPIETLTACSKKAIHLCGGLPFAIFEMGLSVCGRTLEMWEKELEKWAVIPHNNIQKKLETGYESLQDDYEKDLFLLVAMFFVGKDRDHVVKILEQNDFHPTVELQNLVDRSLMSVDNDNKLVMHQLLQKTGREIIRKKLRDDPENTSRLLQVGESINVLEENMVNEIARDIKDESLCGDYTVTEPTEMSNSQSLEEGSILRYLFNSLKQRSRGLLWGFSERDSMLDKSVDEL